MDSMCLRLLVANQLRKRGDVSVAGRGLRNYTFWERAGIRRVKFEGWLFGACYEEFDGGATRLLSVGMKG